MMDDKIGSKVFFVDIRKFIILSPEIDKNPIIELAKKTRICN